VTTRRSSPSQGAHSIDGAAPIIEAESASAGTAISMFIFFSAWLGVGLVLAALLVRRGHDRRMMTALGVGLGPLLIALLVEPAPRGRAWVIDRGVAGPGTLDVLIVLAANPEDIDELRPTLDAVVTLLRTTTIVTVVPYECVGPAAPGDDVMADAITRLQRSGARIAPIVPRLVVVTGHARRAPSRYAARHDIKLTLHAGGTAGSHTAR
jgi:hypothetical protein